VAAQQAAGRATSATLPAGTGTGFSGSTGNGNSGNGNSGGGNGKGSIKPKRRSLLEAAQALVGGAVAGGVHADATNDRLATLRGRGRALRFVLGTDDRVEDTTDTYPMRSAGKLLYNAPNGAMFYCSAVLVSPNVILTAAHCIYTYSSG
jgi:V8-like Glu-specific endopeptidase